MDADATFERYSDSASSYVVLDPHNPSVWKQLYRAAKAKQKLKLRVTVPNSDEEDKGPKPVTVEDVPEPESNESSQSKPEAPLISTAAEAGYPLFNASHNYMDAKESPEPATSHKTETMSQPAKDLDERLERAMSHLQLSSAYLRNPTTNLTQLQQEEVKAANFAVCCNNCDRTVPDTHYHCSTCDDGDFDLCPHCVEQGVTCHSDQHWLIKRFVRGDQIVVSTTETIAPKSKAAPVRFARTDPRPTWRSRPSMTNVATPPVSARAPLRTCNNCVTELPDKEFLHCTTCEDFDLCQTCFLGEKHGHHPKHGFLPAVEGTVFPMSICKRLAPGRYQRHHAICDGCDKFIFGVRHKCLDCPDWDYCSDCVVNAGFVHPNHRFVPIYEQFDDVRALSASRPCHFSICCDGPLCEGTRKSYIFGDRFKCTVCHDTDFCANCEASPANTHNRTHPLIKFKTPVRRVEVTTLGEDENGQKMPAMGDKLARKPVAATRPTPPIGHAPTSLHTVVDVKPVTEQAPVAEKAPVVQEVPVAEKAPVAEEAPAASSHAGSDSPRPESQEQTAVAQNENDTQATMVPFNPADLVAVFERDTVVDGTIVPPNHSFQQTWVLRNAGNVAWPAGCSVKFVGGDYMGHVDSSHPAGIHDLVSASESTICYRPLAPGQEFAFTVLLRTPAREGKIISWWRLTTKDGQKFGHRLWCDVTVRASKVIDEPERYLGPLNALEDYQKMLKILQDQRAAARELETQRELALKRVLEPKSESSSKSVSPPQMVFPKLEKESPEASFHEEAKHLTSPANGEVAANEEVAEDFEDCGVDEAWAEESDDGFLTDEEYDILDASDEEYLDNKDKNQRK